MRDPEREPHPPGAVAPKEAPPDRGDASAVLDDVAVLASRALDVPVAIVSCGDDPVRPVVACTGIDVADAALVARLADAALRDAGLLEIGDAAADPCLAGHPLVRGGLRFFAAAALVAPGGEVLGALWVLDRRERHLDAAQRDTLQRLARTAAHALASRRQAAVPREHDATAQRLALVARDTHNVVILTTPKAGCAGSTTPSRASRASRRAR